MDIFLGRGCRFLMRELNRFRRFFRRVAVVDDGESRSLVLCFIVFLGSWVFLEVLIFFLVNDISFFSGFIFFRIYLGFILGLERFLD